MDAIQQTRIAQFAAEHGAENICADTVFTGDDTFKVVVGTGWTAGAEATTCITVGRGLTMDESADVQEQASRAIWALRFGRESI